ncbi:hypothetical protein NAF17_05250 [Mucilaginibacter sp. RB4R14]|uniref:hypothetical protein n=1 Tax=Mucilaginibacter aurantiaciroseus TaxID=2949308 RepID=UPI0020909F9D|nr:hypothetical protein [Mucilaginibacter aurantiaciroseus]MCO5934935.1 hypothetical protein [Mucilaginibacter aurantiaciroseus]
MKEPMGLQQIEMLLFNNDVFAHKAELLAQWMHCILPLMICPRFCISLKQMTNRFWKVCDWN